MSLTNKQKNELYEILSAIGVAQDYLCPLKQPDDEATRKRNVAQAYLRCDEAKIRLRVFLA